MVNLSILIFAFSALLTALGAYMCTILTSATITVEEQNVIAKRLSMWMFYVGIVFTVLLGAGGAYAFATPTRAFGNLVQENLLPVGFLFLLAISIVIVGGILYFVVGNDTIFTSAETQNLAFARSAIVLLSIGTVFASSSLTVAIKDSAIDSISSFVKL
jgi:hypothetical protein